MKVSMQAMGLTNPIRGNRVDGRSPSKTWWWGDSTEAKRTYLCKPVLSSV